MCNVNENNKTRRLGSRLCDNSMFKKAHLIIGHNFGKCRPIFTLMTPCCHRVSVCLLHAGIVSKWLTGG